MKNKTLALLFWGVYLVASAQTWTPMAAGLLPNNRAIFSISAVGDKVVWAVASEEYYQAPIPFTHSPYILRSSDGGQNWTVHEVEEAVGTISFQIVAVDSLTAWITTQDFSSGPGRALYKTADGGVTWTKKLTNSSAGVALNRFPDGQHWLAHNRQSTSLSVNDGENWTNQSITGYQSNEFQLLNSGANMSATVGDTLWNGTSNGRIIRFTEYGNTYSFINVGLGTATTIMSVAFEDHLNGLCWTQNVLGANRIARSTDGGATWSILAQQPGVSIGWNIAAVPGSPGTFVLASNYNVSQGKIAITTNFGDSWLVQNIGQSLNAVAFDSPNTGWVGGGRILASGQPAMFKYTNSISTGNKETLPELPGLTATPNPVDDVVRFDFEGAEQAGDWRATLSDQAGSVVFSGILSEKHLDMKHLPTGVYFLTLTVNGRKGHIKLIKR